MNWLRTDMAKWWNSLQTERQTNIVTFRSAIAAEKIKIIHNILSNINKHRNITNINLFEHHRQQTNIAKQWKLLW